MKHDPTLYEPPCMFCEIGSVVGSIIGAGASLIGGAMSADAAEDASDAQVRAAEIAAGVQREGLAFQKEMFDTSRADLSPWRATGGAALNTMSDLFIPGGQPRVRLQNQLNELMARRAVLARTGGQPTAPEQQQLSAGGQLASAIVGSPDWWRTVRTSPQWDPGGDGGGGEGAGSGH